MAAFPAARVYGGALLFPIERAREVLTAYELWTRDLDDAATTCVRLPRVPPLPDLPECLRGRARRWATSTMALDRPAAAEPGPR